MKHDAHSEWISIGDFMAGIVGVLVLFFTIAVLISIASKADMQAKRVSKVEKIMGAVERKIENSGHGGIDFLPSQGVIRLKDSSFAKGSACLDKRIREELSVTIAPIIRQAMLEDVSLSLQIEGHSDAIPVTSGSSNVKLVCAPFDDNYTLSAGRAREARNALMDSLDSPDIIRRIAVVGFGPDRLLNTASPDSAENRRVEVRFILNGDE